MTEELTPEEVELKSELKALLEKFRDVLLDKLMANEKKYGFGNSWKLNNWEEQLQHDLLEHVKKGDPRDTAIFSLFAWYHNWSTAPKNKPSYLDSLTKWEGMAFSSLLAVLTKWFNCDEFELRTYSRPSVETRIWFDLKFDLPEWKGINRTRWVSGSSLEIVKRRLIKVLDQEQVCKERLSTAINHEKPTYNNPEK